MSYGSKVYARGSDGGGGRGGKNKGGGRGGGGSGKGGRPRAGVTPGYVYLLRPTPELWARSLNHRTQIVQELDAAYVSFRLGLRPNMVVAESGTGSGAMSHGIMRAVAPGGMLHTFEFNKHRVKEARREFEENGVKHLARVYWRDVCGTPSSVDGSDEKNEKGGRAAEGEKDGVGDEDEEQMGHGGFHPLGPSSAHAVFLDLPMPWLAVPHASRILKPDGNLCSYSPCVEQVQRTCEALRLHGFHSLKTVEVRQREHYVDEVELESPPQWRLPREPTERAPRGGWHGATNKAKEAEATDAAATTAIKGDGDLASTPSLTNGKGSNPKDRGPDTGESAAKRRKVLVARPFATMRGHTAFLTFATAGLRARRGEGESHGGGIDNDKVKN